MKPTKLIVKEYFKDYEPAKRSKILKRNLTKILKAEYEKELLNRDAKHKVE